MNDQPTDPTIKRVLGPGGPEILCDECFDKLDAYVELELAGHPADERIPGMRSHLAGCPACHEEYESLRALVQSDDSAG
jgi:anti-sigma factor RsiW